MIQFKSFALVAILFVLFFANSHSAIYDAKLTNSAGSAYSLNFDKDVTLSYADQITINPAKAYLRVYSTDAASLTGKYVAAVYRIDKGPYFIITYAGWTDTSLAHLVDITSCGSSCYYATSEVSMSFLQFEVPPSGGTPGASFFPSYIQVVVSPSKTANDPSAVFFPVSSGNLIGSYSGSASGYNQATGTVSYTVTGATWGSTNVYPLRNKNYLSAGVCNDARGVSCLDAKAAAWGSSQTYSTGITTGNPAIPKTVYFVVNGMSTGSLCIGPSLSTSSSLTGPGCPSVTACGSSSPVCPSGGVLKGSTLTASASAYNSGNVNSGPYTMTLTITNSSGGVVSTQTYSYSSLGAGTSKSETFTHTPPSDYTGSLTATASISHTFSECGGGGGHSSSSSKTVYFGSGFKLYIDNVETSTFGQIYRPYNLSVVFTDSNNVPYNRGRIEIVETNGLLPSAPMQIWLYDGSGKTGLLTKSYSTVYTNSRGLVNFTYVPTGNENYAEFANLSDYIGGYSLFLNAYSPTGTCVRTLTLNATSMSQQPISSPNSLSVYNQNSSVHSIYDLLYTTYSNVHSWLYPS